MQYALGANYTSTTAGAGILECPDDAGRQRAQDSLAEYLDNPDFQGQPKLRRTEPRVYFDSFMEEAPP